MIQKRILNMVLLAITIITIIIACEKDNDKTRYIKIEADVPSTVYVGHSDTLRFQVISEEPLKTISLFENKKQYVYFDKNLLGKKTLEKEIKLIYKPIKAGYKNMEFRVVNNKLQEGFIEFSIQITE